MFQSSLYGLIGHMQAEQRFRQFLIQFARQIFRLQLGIAAQILHQHVLFGNSDHIGQLALFVNLIPFLPNIRFFSVRPHKLRLGISLLVQKLKIADQRQTFFAQLNIFQILRNFLTSVLQPGCILLAHILQIPFLVIFADNFVQLRPAFGNGFFFRGILFIIA